MLGEAERSQPPVEAGAAGKAGAARAAGLAGCRGGGASGESGPLEGGLGGSSRIRITDKCEANRRMRELRWGGGMARRARPGRFGRRRRAVRRPGRGCWGAQSAALKLSHGWRI